MSGLEARALRLERQGRAVLAGVDARFAPGRVTAILGPNGAGKSSLLACLAGLLKPQAGEALLDGRGVSALPPGERARAIGLLPQRGEMHWNMDARSLVALGRLPHRGRGGETAADRAAIDRAMAATDCAHLAERGIATLSGGEQSRVLLARVLAGEPRWLLADEPLASLDLAHQLDALATFRACAAAGAGVVLVLHDLNHALRHADDVLLLHGGTVAAWGPARETLKSGVIETVYGVRLERIDGPGGPSLLPAP